MRNIWKSGVLFVLLILFSGQTFAQQFNPEDKGMGNREMRRGGMPKGEVSAVNKDNIAISLSDGNTQNIKITNELRIVKEKRISAQDIKIGQNVFVIGRREQGQKVRAFMVKVLNENTNRGGPKPQGEKEGPVIGSVTGINPLLIKTHDSVIEVDLSEVKNIAEEVSMSLEELKKGDKVILIGPPEQIFKLIVVESFPVQNR